MIQFIQLLKKMDFWLLGAVFFVALAGLSQLYLIEKFRDLGFIFEKQIIFFISGVLLTSLIALFPCELLKNRGVFVFALYLLAIILLAATAFFAPVKRGVESWLTLGPIDIQPVEIVKITLLLILAKYFSFRSLQVFRLKTIFVSGLYVLVPVILTMRQPDLGSAAILILLWLAMIFLVGIRVKHFLVFLLILFFLAIAGWNFLSPYQKERITGFLSPQEDILGKNYSALQAKIAIGSGGLWGRGEAQSFQTINGFLPEPHTDFIFASFVETRGFLGAAALLASYLIIQYRLIIFTLDKRQSMISKRVSAFAKIFCLGLAALLFFHIIINIGINLQLLPVTGIPLPFFSYGGSYLISLFIALGIYQSFYIRARS